MTLDFKEEKTKHIGTTIFLFVLIIFAAPFLQFWIAYFVGWISKLVIGKYLMAGFAILNIDLPLDKIPLVSGCLGWIASFFMHFKQNS